MVANRPTETEHAVRAGLVDKGLADPGGHLDVLSFDDQRAELHDCKGTVRPVSRASWGRGPLTVRIDHAADVRILAKDRVPRRSVNLFGSAAFARVVLLQEARSASSRKQTPEVAQTDDAVLREGFSIGRRPGAKDPEVLRQPSWSAASVCGRGEGRRTATPVSTVSLNLMPGVPTVTSTTYSKSSRTDSTGTCEEPVPEAWLTGVSSCRAERVPSDKLCRRAERAMA